MSKADHKRNMEILEILNGMIIGSCEVVVGNKTVVKVLSDLGWTTVKTKAQAKKLQMEIIAAY